MKKLFLKPQGYKPQFGVVKNMCVQLKIMFPSSLSSYDENSEEQGFRHGKFRTPLMYSGRHVFILQFTCKASLTHSDFHLVILELDFNR